MDNTMLVGSQNPLYDVNQGANRLQEQYRLMKVQAVGDHSLEKSAYSAQEKSAKSAYFGAGVTSGQETAADAVQSGPIGLNAAQTSQTLFFAQQIASAVPDANVDQYVQAANPDQSEYDKAVAAYQEIVGKTPGERMREQVLRSMGLTEDDLENMSPEERKKVEEKIAQMIDKNVKESVSENFTPDSGETSDQKASQLEANINLGNEVGDKTLAGGERQDVPQAEQNRDDVKKIMLQNII